MLVYYDLSTELPRKDISFDFISYVCLRTLNRHVLLLDANRPVAGLVCSAARYGFRSRFTIFDKPIEFNCRGQDAANYYQRIILDL